MWEGRKRPLIKRYVSIEATDGLTKTGSVTYFWRRKKKQTNTAVANEKASKRLETKILFKVQLCSPPCDPSTRQDAACSLQALPG